MNLNADQLAFLASKGISINDLAALARMGEIKRDPTNAERQARYRENKRNALRNDVTPPNDISNPPSISPDNDKSLSTPKPKRAKSSVGDPLPDGWKPILTDAAQKIVDGWPPGWLAGQVAAFQDHATDKGRKSKDWQAAFRTWIAKADEWGKQKNANRNSSTTGNRSPDGWGTVLREVGGRETRNSPP